jgi:hypothetical protein
MVCVLVFQLIGYLFLPSSLLLFVGLVAFPPLSTAPADTETNAELLLPDAPSAAPSAPVGEEFNSQTTERARALPRPRARALEEACEPAHLTRLMSGRTMSLLLVSPATSRVCASLVHLANSGAG